MVGQTGLMANYKYFFRRAVMIIDYYSERRRVREDESKVLYCIATQMHPTWQAT